MQITLRFYYPEDADLILMKVYEQRNFCARIIECVTAYAEGRPYVYSFNDKGQGVSGGLPPVVKVNIVIREDRHPKVVSFLNQYETSSRKSLLKALLRASFEEYPASSVLSSLGFKSMPKEKPHAGLMLPDPGKETAATGDGSSVHEKNEAENGGFTQSVAAVSSAKKAQHEERESQNASGTAATKKVSAKETDVSHAQQEPNPRPSPLDTKKDRDLFEMFLNM